MQVRVAKGAQPNLKKNEIHYYLDKNCNFILKKQVVYAFCSMEYFREISTSNLSYFRKRNPMDFLYITILSFIGRKKVDCTTKSFKKV